MKIKLLNYGAEKMPMRAHENDAGADVYAQHSYKLDPHETRKVSLGFGLEIPDGFMGLILSRSGLASKGLICEHPPIDSGYRGEIHAIVRNTTNKTITIYKDDRIAQLVIVPVVIADFITNSFEERGNNGFGSTGK